MDGFVPSHAQWKNTCQEGISYRCCVFRCFRACLEPVRAPTLMFEGTVPNGLSSLAWTSDAVPGVYVCSTLRWAGAPRVSVQMREQGLRNQSGEIDVSNGTAADLGMLWVVWVCSDRWRIRLGSKVPIFGLTRCMHMSNRCVFVLVVLGVAGSCHDEVGIGSRFCFT